MTRSSLAEARRITVTVHGNDVTLSGAVRSWEERDTANNSAWGTPGVRDGVDMMTLAH